MAEKMSLTRERSQAERMRVAKAQRLTVPDETSSVV